MKKIKETLPREKLKILKKDMKKFISLKPTNYTVAIHQRIIRDLLENFNNLDQEDLRYLKPLLEHNAQ